MAAPLALAAVGAGAIIKTYGQIKANEEQAAAERQNAAWYREQAKFARDAGDRQRRIFDRETLKLQGTQVSAFAKAGIDAGSGSASYFMAKEALFRQEESSAIKQEADMNVRLALLRADQAEKTAGSLTDPTNQFLMGAGNFLSAGGSIL